MGNKISSIKERILVVSESQENSKQAFFKKIGMTYGNFTGKNKERPINSDGLNNILLNYPVVNPEWLLTGRGPMLRPVEAMEETPRTLEEPRSRYGKAREVNPATCSACKERERTIVSKDKEIGSLERQIGSLKAGFEKQIEDLRNNLGMVITSKDEMLAMKDQILEIQAEKIAELEDFKKMQEKQMRKQRNA